MDTHLTCVEGQPASHYAWNRMSEGEILDEAGIQIMCSLIDHRNGR